MSVAGDGRTPPASTAVVLAAGFGSRLADEGAEGVSKLLLTVGGEPIYRRTFSALEAAGCTDIVCVLGWKADEVERALTEGFEGGARLRFVRNPRFDLANGISVLCAREVAGERFLLLMADHLFDSDLLGRAAAHLPPEGGISLFVDEAVESVFDIDDAMKVVTRDGLVTRIAKDLSSYDCIDTGLFACTPALMEALEAIRGERGDAALADGVRRLADLGLVEAVGIDGAFWQDVDTPEMLAHAERVLGA